MRHLPWPMEIGARARCNAAPLGYFELFGETLKTNQAMQNFACEAGFAFTTAPAWHAVRFDERIPGQTGN